VLKMIQAHLDDNQCCAKQEVDSSLEVASVAEYKLAQNSLAFEEIQLQHAASLDMLHNTVDILHGNHQKLLAKCQSESVSSL